MSVFLGRARPISCLHWSVFSSLANHGVIRSGRAYSTLPLIRYTDTMPETLYRIQTKLPVRLRDKAVQERMGRKAYDLETKLVDNKNMVYPIEGDIFTKPNGMSVRPVGPTFFRTLDEFKGDFRVYTLPGGSKIPSGLMVVREHSDHHSIQVAEPMTLEEFNEKLTGLLKDSLCQTKDEVLAALKEDEYEDQIH